MTVLVDSWAWIEYLKGTKAGERAKGIIESSEDVAIVSTINIAEVFHWILRFYDEKLAKEKLRVIKRRTFVCDVNEEIALRAAKVKKERKWGLGDSIIYATAKEEKAKVLTGDPDFKGLDDVIFIG